MKQKNKPNQKPKTEEESQKRKGDTMKNEYAQKLEKLFQGADEASVNRALSIVGEFMELPEEKRELVERFISGINK